MPCHNKFHWNDGQPFQNYIIFLILLKKLIKRPIKRTISFFVWCVNFQEFANFISRLKPSPRRNLLFHMNFVICCHNALT